MSHPELETPRAAEAHPLAFHAPAQPVAPIAAETWPVEEVLALFDLPFNDLMYRAQQTHRAHFDPTEVELATLLSIKTGGCEEDCGYCPQAARYDTGVVAKKLLSTEDVLEAARAARRQRRHPLLHGRRLARAQGARHGKGRGHGARGQGARPGNLRHARHAEGRPGAAPEGRRARLLQPQPRYRARVLRQHHLDPRVPGPPGYAGSRARSRPQGLLRRHRRHGRDRARSAPA